jgi:pseudouridylate synthase
MTRPRRGARRQAREILDVADDVARAVRSGKPVVALETSVAVQGLPPPHGLDAAHRCEAAIRAVGALPATIGVLDGRIVVGLTAEQVGMLTDPLRSFAKAGERDLAALCASGASAGTTVSATCAAAGLAGIRFVATGGVGGVHRTSNEELDVSADLLAISRIPVAVVCSGAKAVLDVPRTVEVLEALSVLVLGFGTSEFPNFYSAESGISLEHYVASSEEAARTLRIRFETLRQGGALVVQAPPRGGLGREVVERAVGGALRALGEARIRGKAVTPFLLAAVDRATGGEARRVNIELLEANARLAGQIAVDYARFAR